MTTQIRRLLPEDAALALEAVRALKPDRASDAVLDVAYLRGLLARPDCVLLVALRGPRPVGFAVAYVLDRLDGPRPMIYLYEVGVAADCRRQGVARGLIDWFKAHMATLHARKLFVQADRDNAAALALYRRTGGRENPSGEQVLFVYDR